MEIFDQNNVDQEGAVGSGKGTFQEEQSGAKVMSTNIDPAHCPIPNIGSTSDASPQLFPQTNFRQLG